MAYDSNYSHYSEQNVAPGVTKKGSCSFLETYRQEENYKANNLLSRVALSARQLRIHWQGVVVIDGQLKE